MFRMPPREDEDSETCQSDGVPYADERRVVGLQKRLEGLDRLLRQICPGERDYEEWLSSVESNTIGKPLSRPRTRPSSLALASSPIEKLTNAIRSVGEDNIASLDDGHDRGAAPAAAPGVIRLADEFFGTSSAEILTRIALSAKDEYACAPKDPTRPPLSNKREEFWTPRPWEKPSSSFQAASYTFPDRDLADSLIDLYFNHVNLYLPLLHRPSFWRLTREGLQFMDDEFAAVYLLACSVGSRFSTDARVLMDGIDSFHSAGWKWYAQVEVVQETPPAEPTLYNLQSYCLSIMFLHCSSASLAIWPMIGIAFRLAQEVGIHRRNTRAPTMEGELWKRTFWVLLCLDRIMCVSLGRPLTVEECDYDLDMPIDCDDEYWEHPDLEKRFKQPLNKPSLISAFIQQLKLMQILSYCIRGIYSLRKMNMRLGLEGEQWKSNIVAELDMSLNKWLVSLPEHLRWDFTRKHGKFINLSAMLHVLFCHIRILVHCPFSLPGKPSPLPFPSLAICRDAALAGCNIAYTALQRNGLPPMPAIQLSIFTYTVVLLFAIWDRQKAGTPPDWRGDVTEVFKCLHVLKVAEERWYQAGRMRDILSELAFAGDPNQEVALQRKGGRSSPQDLPSFLSQALGTTLYGQGVLPTPPPNPHPEKPLPESSLPQTKIADSEMQQQTPLLSRRATKESSKDFGLLRAQQYRYESHLDTINYPSRPPRSVAAKTIVQRDPRVHISPSLVTSDFWSAFNASLTMPVNPPGCVSAGVQNHVNSASESANPSASSRLSLVQTNAHASPSMNADVFQYQPPVPQHAQQDQRQNRDDIYLTGDAATLWPIMPPGLGFDAWDEYLPNTSSFDLG
ncbi:unnamed protein product [Cyclocybe aegerita]|uniref:Xylanolytic transcriptional activator regulatory domain-containing protein n=1 Tax=Cyclocybe aegerita TaxID=1973307 RepID=A0A8S0XZX8_CYCAE|nr:unnamed protein product [Cyclocybe aegerita]